MFRPPCSPARFKIKFFFFYFSNLLEHYIPKLFFKSFLYLTSLLAWNSSVTFNSFILFALQYTLCNVTSSFFIYFIIYTSIVNNLGHAFFFNLDNEEVSHPALVAVSHATQLILQILPFTALVMFWWHSSALQVAKQHLEESQEEHCLW